MRVFVTGGSGFVGGHVIERLAADGHDVRAMARSDRSAGVVEGFGAVAVRCDLDTVGAEHLAGCDAVVHAAAHVEEWGPWEAFERGNVDGTRRVLDAAIAAGVGRFVHIGTEAALFDGGPLVDVDERAPFPARHRFPYPATKAAAEQLVRDAQGLTAVVLRPRFVWGPRDASVLPALLEMAAQGRYAWLDGGRHRTSTCHVHNLAHAVALAIAPDAPGGVYFVADDGTRTLKAFLTALAATRGVDLPGRSVPGAVARPLSSALGAVWTWLGRDDAPPLVPFTAHMLSREVTVRTDHIRDALGYRPVISVDDGLAGLATA